MEDRVAAIGNDGINSHLQNLASLSETLQSRNDDQLSSDVTLSVKDATLRPCSPFRHPPVYTSPISKRSSLKFTICLSENGGSVKLSDEDALNSPPSKIRRVCNDEREVQIAGSEATTQPPPIGVSKQTSNAVLPKQTESAAADLNNKHNLFELLDMCVPLYVDMSIRNQCIVTPRKVSAVSQSSTPLQEAVPRNAGIQVQSTSDLAFGARLDDLWDEVFNLALLSLALPESPIQQPLSVELKAQESKLKMARLKLLMSQCSLLALQEDILKSAL